MVARQDAPMVGLGDNIGQVLDGFTTRPMHRASAVPDGGDIWPLWQAQGRGFWLPSEEGMSSNTQELSGVKLTVRPASNTSATEWC